MKGKPNTLNRVSVREPTTPKKGIANAGSSNLVPRLVTCTASSFCSPALTHPLAARHTSKTTNPPTKAGFINCPIAKITPRQIQNRAEPH